MCEHDFWCQKFKFVNKMYSGPSGEDLILTWSLVLWIHKDILCCHGHMNVFPGGTPRHPAAGKRKKHNFYQGQKR